MFGIGSEDEKTRSVLLEQRRNDAQIGLGGNNGIIMICAVDRACAFELTSHSLQSATLSKQGCVIESSA